MALGFSGEVLDFHASNPFILSKYTEKTFVTKLIKDDKNPTLRETNIHCFRWHPVFLDLLINLMT